MRPAINGAHPKGFLFGVFVVLACALVMLVPTGAGAALDDSDIPGKPAVSSGDGSLDQTTDHDDVMRVFLLAGQKLDIAMTVPPTADFDLYLFDPTADSLLDTAIGQSTHGVGATENISHTAAQSGWHYIWANVWTGTGFFTMDVTPSWPSAQPPDTPEQVWGGDRYETAVKIGKAAFPGWRNVDHVIIACGEDRAAADPLAASGLTWTYGAPILLVRSTSVPSVVIQALKDIRNANGPFEIHVVGGPVSVPQARLSEIAAQVSGVTFDRIAPFGNRYELAASIAMRMQAERPGENWSGFFGKRALIANGEDPDKFFDALALSPIAAHNGFPILLVRKDSIPWETANAMTILGLTNRIVGGGPNTVSDDVLFDLNAGMNVAGRWFGQNRFETARIIMQQARNQLPPFVDTANVGVAAKLPDALAGGAMIGLRGGSILICKTYQVTDPTFDFLHNNSPGIGEVYVFGGPNSVHADTFQHIGAALQP